MWKQALETQARDRYVGGSYDLVLFFSPVFLTHNHRIPQHGRIGFYGA